METNISNSAMDKLPEKSTGLYTPAGHEIIWSGPYLDGKLTILQVEPGKIVCVLKSQDTEFTMHAKIAHVWDRDIAAIVLSNIYRGYIEMIMSQRTSMVANGFPIQ